jgi:TPR repeat protein
MAHKQYNHPLPPPASRGQYPEQARPNDWSNGGGQYHQNALQQQGQGYAEWDYSQPGEQYHQHSSPAQHGDDGYPRTQQGYSQPDGQYYDQQQHNQQYQYEPRYRSQGQSDYGQAERRQDVGEHRSKAKQRPPQVEPNVKSKCMWILIRFMNKLLTVNKTARERILPAIPSPIVVAWDNPFPVFNPKKKDAKKKHSSLDKDVSKMKISDQPDARPLTSQSHRRGDESRPHTSQGHRRPEVQVPRSGVHSPHPMSLTDRAGMLNQRKFSNGQTPVRPPLNPLGSDRSIGSFQGEPAPRLQQSQRSMTLPDDVATGMTKKKLQKHAMPQSNRQHTASKGVPQEPYNYVPAPISPLPSPPVAQPNGVIATGPGDLRQNALISPEMPNFDAISPSVNERSEDPLHVPTNNAQPAYRKAEYQAPPDDAALSKTQSHPQYPNIQTDQPNFAGFTFDLPADSNIASYSDQQRSQVSYNSRSPQLYNAGSPLAAGAQNPPRSQSRAEQLLLRPASRQGYDPPRSVNNIERYGSPAIQQAQYRSTSDAQQYPSRSQSRSANRDATYEHSQVEHSGVGDLQQSRLDEMAGRYNRHPSNETHWAYQGQRQYPAQINDRQDPFNALQQPGNQTVNSAHPPPSRQYHARNTSGSLNSDALPAHPVPVRPGLMQETSAASAAIGEGSKPPYQLPPISSDLAQMVSYDEKPPPITAYDLNLLLQTIKSNPSDHKTTLTLAKRLVEAASVLSDEGGKADAKTTQKNRERYIFDAHRYLKKLVHQNYPEAMFYLAECHGQGSLGLQVDPKEAFHLYTSAAKAGHAQAAYRVAVCSEMGSEEGGGTRRDPIKAMHWYKRAASMGDTPAMYKFGIILLKGLLGQPKNPREAISWLKRAAAQADRDNPHALHELGLLYETASPSDSIVKDENYSRQLFLQAAELGYKFSQFRLGSAYEYGMLGCPIDPRQSIAWYTRAAAQGEHQSELALSGWYLTGSDGILQQSDTEAYLWARKAANSRLAKAEYAMGYFTEVGIGCTANLDEAKKWYWRAACELLF